MSEPDPAPDPNGWVAVVGSANVDLIARVSRHPRPGHTVLATGFSQHLGGKGLNQAVAARRAGASVSFSGAVGSDHHGHTIRQFLEAEQVDVTGLRELAGPSGLALITVDDGAENSIVVVPGANLEVRDPLVPAGASVVVGQLEVPLTAVEAAFEEARDLGAITILNPAPMAVEPDQILALADLVDVLVPNEHEMRALGSPERLLAAGVGAVVVTRGAAGVEIHADGHTRSIPAFAVSPVDTTGAGDAFCGVMAARLAGGDPLVEAVRWGAAAGALATTVRGADPPDERAIRALMSSAG